MGIGLSEYGLATRPYKRTCFFTARLIGQANFTLNWRRCMRNLVQSVDTGVPQHNDKRFVFSVVDEAGEAVDITSISEITWVLARNVNSAALLTKTLSGGDIQMTGTDAFYFDFADTESATVGQTGRLYHECRVTLSTGEKRTAFAGKFEHRNM